MFGNTITAVLALCAFLGAAAAVPVFVNELGDEFALVPVQHTRVRREKVFEEKVGQNGMVYGRAEPGERGGAKLTGGYAGTLFENDAHKLSGTAEWTRTYNQPHGLGNGPASVSGGVLYNHDRGHLGLDAQTVRGQGTGVKAQGGVDLWRSNDGRGTVSLDAFYNKHLGGPYGNGPSNWGAMTNFNYRP